MKQTKTKKNSQIEIIINAQRNYFFIGPRSKLPSVLKALKALRFSEMKNKSREIKTSSKPSIALRTARMKIGLSQTELSKKLKVPQYNISKMEKGVRPIGKNMAKKIAKYLKVDYRSFL